MVTKRQTEDDELLGSIRSRSDHTEMPASNSGGGSHENSDGHASDHHESNDGNNNNNGSSIDHEIGNVRIPPKLPKLDLEVAQQLSEIVESQRSARSTRGFRLRSPRTPKRESQTIVVDQSESLLLSRSGSPSKEKRHSIVSPRILSTPPRLKALFSHHHHDHHHSPKSESPSVRFHDREHVLLDRESVDVINANNTNNNNNNERSPPSASPPSFGSGSSDGNILLLNDSQFHNDYASKKHHSVTIDLNNVPFTPMRHRSQNHERGGKRERTSGGGARNSLRLSLGRSPSSPNFLGDGYNLSASIQSILAKSPPKADRTSLRPGSLPASKVDNAHIPRMLGLNRDAPQMSKHRSLGNLSLEGLNPFQRRKSNRESLTLDLEKIRREGEYAVDVQVIDEETMPETPRTPTELNESNFSKNSRRAIEIVKHYLDAYGGSLAGMCVCVLIEPVQFPVT